MLPNPGTVEIHHGSELCLVHFEDGDSVARGSLKALSIPKIVSTLVRSTANIPEFVVILLTVQIVVDERGKQLLGLVLVDVGKRGKGRMHEPRHGYCMAKRLRNLIRSYAVLDAPGSIKGQRCSVGLRIFLGREG